VSEPVPDHRRRFWGVVAVLLAICATFLVLTSSQGPKVESSSIDTAAAAHRSGSELVLTLNRPPADIAAAQVEVSPSTPVSVSTRDRSVTVQFGFTLIPATTYSVRIAGVEGAHGGAAADIETSFTTPWAPPELGESAEGLPRIDRTAAADRVVSGPASAAKVLWTGGPGTKAMFAVPTQNGAVVVTETAGRTAVEAVGGDALDAGTSQGSPTGAGRTGPGAVVVAIRDPAETESQLLVVDGGKLRPVLNLRGEPQRAMSWMPVPGDKRVLALTLDGDLSLVDPEGHAPAMPLGSVSALDSVSADGLSSVVQKGRTVLRMDLRNGQTTEPVLSAPAAGEARGRITEVRDGVYLQQRTTLDGTGTLVVDDGASARAVFAWEAQKVKQVGYALSEDGRYVVVESTPTEGDIDFERPRPSGAATTVDVIGIALGQQVAQLPGSVAGW